MYLSAYYKIDSRLRRGERQIIIIQCNRCSNKEVTRTLPDQKKEVINSTIYRERSQKGFRKKIIEPGQCGSVVKH